jgi:hypothetical protein
VVNFTSRPFYPRGKSPRYPLDRRLGDTFFFFSQGLRRKYTHFTHHSQNTTQHLVPIYTGISVSAGQYSSLCLNLFNRQKRQLSSRCLVMKVHILWLRYSGFQTSRHNVKLIIMQTDLRHVIEGLTTKLFSMKIL